MGRPRLLLVFILSLLWTAGDVSALTGDLKKDPSDVLKQYLSLDLRGARLEAMSWETLKPFINWKAEPAWGHVVVIAGYEVAQDIKQWEIVSMLEVVIPVEFRVLGAVYWETATFLPEPRVEEARFRIKGVGDRWRIIEPILPPHVGQKRLINFVREAMLTESDQFKLAVLATLRDELGKAR